MIIESGRWPCAMRGHRSLSTIISGKPDTATKRSGMGSHREPVKNLPTTGVGDDGEVIDVPSPSEHLREHELSTTDHRPLCQ